MKARDYLWLWFCLTATVMLAIALASIWVYLNE